LTEALPLRPGRIDRVAFQPGPAHGLQLLAEGAFYEEGFPLGFGVAIVHLLRTIHASNRRSVLTFNSGSAIQVFNNLLSDAFSFRVA